MKFKKYKTSKNIFSNQDFLNENNFGYEYFNHNNFSNYNNFNIFHENDLFWNNNNNFLNLENNELDFSDTIPFVDPNEIVRYDDIYDFVSDLDHRLGKVWREINLLSRYNRKIADSVGNVSYPNNNYSENYQNQTFENPPVQEYNNQNIDYNNYENPSVQEYNNQNIDYNNYENPSVQEYDYADENYNHYDNPEQPEDDYYDYDNSNEQPIEEDSSMDFNYRPINFQEKYAKEFKNPEKKLKKKIKQQPIENYPKKEQYYSNPFPTRQPNYLPQKSLFNPNYSSHEEPIPVQELNAEPLVQEIPEVQEFPEVQQKIVKPVKKIKQLKEKKIELPPPLTPPLPPPQLQEPNFVNNSNDLDEFYNLENSEYKKPEYFVRRTPKDFEGYLQNFNINFDVPWFAYDYNSNEIQSFENVINFSNNEIKPKVPLSILLINRRLIPVAVGNISGGKYFLKNFSPINSFSIQNFKKGILYVRGMPKKSIIKFMVDNEIYTIITALSISSYQRLLNSGRIDLFFERALVKGIAFYVVFTS